MTKKIEKTLLAIAKKTTGKSKIEATLKPGITTATTSSKFRSGD
nr:hypothetical protein [Atopobium minutum]